MAYSNTTGYPSVTEILDPYIDTAWFTQESRDRGSAVHEHAAAYLNNQYKIPIKKEWRGYLESFKRWEEKYLVEVHMVEERLIDTVLGYCGQLDIYCELRGYPGPGVVDIKTGALAVWHPIQLAAYRHLVDLQADKTRWGLVLHLKPDGSGGRVYRLNSNIAQHFNIFLSALNCFKFFKGGSSCKP